MKDETHRSPAERLIALGEIVGPHGIRGLLRFHPYGPATSPLPSDRPLFLTPRPASDGHPDPASAHPIELISARPHGNVLLLQIRGIGSIDEATRVVGTTLAVAETDLPAPAPGEFYVYQLEGLDVVTKAGAHLGTIDRSFSTGANEVLVVRGDDREYLIPVIADVVQAIDLAGGRVVIDPIDGLLEG